MFFEQMDHLHLRTFDKKFIEASRNSRVWMEPLQISAGYRPKTASLSRFRVARTAVFLTLRDGTTIPGAPRLAVANVRTGPAGPPIFSQVQLAKHFTDGGVRIKMGSGTGWHVALPSL